MDELQKESNLKRYQYLPPRDRYRLQKQIKADEEAERIKQVTYQICGFFADLLL